MTDTRTYETAPAALPLYARALLPSLPLVGGLPGVRKDTGGLPELALRRVGVRTDTDHLAAYARLTGHTLSDRLPGLYPHLAAFAPQLALIADRSFPFAALGLVHVASSVTQHRPITVREPYDVVVRSERLRGHRSGRLVDLGTVATVGGEAVWEATTTLLARGAGDPYAPDDSTLAGVEAPVGEVRWSVPGHLGRAFAALSGDRNPIHLTRLTARAFGFPRAIAHGMWTAARALAAVEPTLPAAYRYDVAFRRPVLLPGEVRFGTRVDADGTRLLGVVSSGGTATHLVARVCPLDRG